MKATGIVRRIDDLGRVVIPKEIRRTMRIREGDPLEIYTDNDGEVIFKKYSPIGELAPFATQYAESVGKVSDLPVIICDRDHCVAAAVIAKKEVIERRITPQVEDILEQRVSFIAKPNEIKPIFPLEGVDWPAAVIFPIIAAGDIAGAVIFLKNEKGEIGGDVERGLAEVAANFLGRQMEE